MLKSSARSVIRLRGVRHNNLKNFDLDLPLNQLIVVTGLSGSGKSSLAFDTLFAEGQRRYIETFSPYARQFFDRMDKPQVDSIEGIPPAIAIEQRNAVKTTRSTVGTMTELCDYMKMLWPHVAHLHCRQCGQLVRKDSPQMIWSGLAAREALRNTDLLITFDLPLTEKLTLEESLGLVAKQGYQRLLVEGQVLRLEEVAAHLGGGEGETAKRRDDETERRSEGGSSAEWGVQSAKCKQGNKTARLASLTVIQDRVKLTEANRARFVEACEQAYHFGKGKLALYQCGVGSAECRMQTGEQTSAECGAGSAECKQGNKKTSTPKASPHPNPLPIGWGEGAKAPLRFSNRLHCATCDIEYHEPSPALFSFNHPVGACPACRGFGRVISIDYNLALPDRSKTLAEGVVKPWQSGQSAECQSDLLRMCRRFGVPTDVPFEKLPKKWQDFVIEGEPGYGKDEAHEWPKAWYGIKGYFRWLESKAYKMHVRVLLSRYRTYTPCPDCQGKRFQPEALLYRVLPSGEWGVGSAECKQENKNSELRIPNSEFRGVPSPEPMGLTLADFYQLPIRDALRFIDSLAARYQFRKNDPLGLVLNEIRSRLGYLNEVGLGYLTLDRPTRSLSGGETERVNLTTCLGTRLVNTLFVLDEPSVGLHPRDTERLVRILQQLRDAGNTVLVVEHEASVMRAANQILDIGPGHGATGGQVVFQGSYPEILKAKDTITGQYLSGRKQVEIPQRRPVQVRSGECRVQNANTSAEWGVGSAECKQGNKTRVAAEKGSRFEPLVLHDSVRRIPNGQAVLKLSHATRHNLRDLTVEIPLDRFVCITGVSGSGKTTLVREVLLPALTAQLKAEPTEAKASERLASEPANGEETDTDATMDAATAAELEGTERLGRVLLVDQSILGKTPRSNPAVYIGAFDDIREVFAQSELARQRGLNASAFSFNSGQGQCERCRGAGFEKIEMQFLSDVFIRCPDCNGRRYRSHILEIQITAPAPAPSSKARSGNRSTQTPAAQPMSIADLLEATVEEALAFLSGFAELRPAQRAVQSLRLLEEVGLGYLKLGQPINTLSGGESQRLKLVRELAEAGHAIPVAPSARAAASSSPASGRPTLFLFDEPTTGLHFDDVRVLLKVFQRLVDAGHSVIVIEHNLDVIKSADWLIDLGPDAGDQGGEIVAQGTPEAVAECRQSHTGRALREILAAPQQRMAKP